MGPAYFIEGDAQEKSQAVICIGRDQASNTNQPINVTLRILNRYNRRLVFTDNERLQSILSNGSSKLQTPEMAQKELEVSFYKTKYAFDVFNLSYSNSTSRLV